MKKFRIALTGLLLAMPCVTQVAAAQEQTGIAALSAKSRKHHHHDSSSSDSSSSSDHHKRRGPRGHKGHRGHRGHRGHHGHGGKQGRSLAGEPGNAGNAGTAGNSGNQGPPGTGAISNFITAYQLITGTAADTIAAGGNILFPNISPPAPNSTLPAPVAGVFTVPPGNYEVTYGAKWVPSATPPASVPIALILNESAVPVPGSQLEPFSNDYATITLILNVPAPGTLAVQNRGAVSLILQGAAGQTGAFITLKRIS